MLQHQISEKAEILPTELFMHKMDIKEANGRQGAKIHRKTEFLRYFPDLNGCYPDELLETTFHCAYQDDILLHGILYITKYRICFKSHVLGCRKIVTVDWSHIASVKKAKIAHLFPTAIEMETKSANKYVFASFLNRQNAYRQLITHYSECRLPLISSIATFGILNSEIGRNGQESTLTNRNNANKCLNLSLSDDIKKVYVQMENSNKGSNWPYLKNWINFFVSFILSLISKYCQFIQTCLMVLLISFIVIRLLVMYQNVKNVELKLGRMSKIFANEISKSTEKIYPSLTSREHLNKIIN
ncbi:hypothetical protein GJ496_011094 [Pomphorhynchus laevis]|nr:hypothetical protein GJ496_011094 [Pomphorhynchus laevis]